MKQRSSASQGYPRRAAVGMRLMEESYILTEIMVNDSGAAPDRPMVCINEAVPEEVYTYLTGRLEPYMLPDELPWCFETEGNGWYAGKETWTIGGYWSVTLPGLVDQIISYYYGYS